MSTQSRKNVSKNNRDKRDNRRTQNARRRKSKKYRQLQFLYNIIFALFILLLLIYGIFHVFTPKKNLRSQGIKAYNEGNYDEAIKAFDQALECKQWFSYSIDTDICMYKADSYIKLGDFESSKRVYEAIESGYPERYYDKSKVDFLIELTNALIKYKSGDYVSTVACFNRAVDAGYIEMSLYAANCYEISGKYDEMKKNLDIYTGGFGYTPEICYKYANYYIQLEDYNNALTSIEQGIAAGESIYIQDFAYSQILCYMKLDNYQKAYELAVNYSSLYPTSSDIANIYSYLDTRVNPDTEVIHDIFGQNNKPTDVQDASVSDEN